MCKDLIKDINYLNDVIEVEMKHVKDIHEYYLQRINHDEDCLRITHDKRCRSVLLYDIRDYCSLKTYLTDLKLNEQEFLNMVVDVLELMIKVSADKVLYIHNDSIFLNRKDGRFSLLCLPVEKSEWRDHDEEIKAFLQELLDLVKVEGAYEIIGLIIQFVKDKHSRTVLLLQQLIQRIPKPEPIPFWFKFFHRTQDEDEPLRYPLPLGMRNQQFVHDTSGTYEIEEDHTMDFGSETVVLFSSHKEMCNAYIEDKEHKKTSIKQDEFTIGRDRVCHYIVSKPTISKQHVCIVKEAECFYIKDLNSSNCTYLNGEELTSMELYKLKDQDEITLADELLHFHYEK